MSPAKKQYVLTGRSSTMIFRLPDSDETLTLERGVPTDVPSAFTEVVEANENIYPDGKVPEGAILGREPAQPNPVVPAETEPVDPETPDASQSGDASAS